MISFGANRGELGQLKWKVSHMPRAGFDSDPPTSATPCGHGYVRIRCVVPEQPTFVNEIWASLQRVEAQSSRGATQTGAPLGSRLLCRRLIRNSIKILYKKCTYGSSRSQVLFYVTLIIKSLLINCISKCRE